MWSHFFRVHYRVEHWLAQHRTAASSTLLLVLIAISTILIPILQDGLEPLISTNEHFQALRSLYQTVGSALLGATAIVSSLVLFSMQVNVERMPHGLFRRLSADRILLCAFAAAFMLAILVATLSVIPHRAWMGTATFIALWATLLILILFLYAYRRALVLVNPLHQLGMVVAKSRRDLGTWVRWSQRATPLLEPPKPWSGERHDPLSSKHDLPRLAFFKANVGWEQSARQAVRYSVSFARRYAELGDHEVSAAAMNAIIHINAAYIKAKGKTFFTHNFLFENPLTTDGFINDTLEHLRQTTRIGASRRDEQQIEQTLRALATLVCIYADIDYCNPRASKTHAHLGVGYLVGEIERIVPQNMRDVVMEGVRLMGQCADSLLAAEGPEGIRTLVQKLGVIGCCGVANADLRPVTLTCVEQLARLSFSLLLVRSHDIQFLAEEIRGSMSLLAKFFLAVPDTTLARTHSTFLGPYYAAISTEALSVQLTRLVNVVADAKSDDKDTQQVIKNLERWAEGLFRTEKEVLLEAIRHRSYFTSDMIHWISRVTSILLAVSNAAACDNHTRTEIRKHALWLIAVLSFVPEDIETVNFVETFGMTNTLFEAALDAHKRGCPEVAAEISRLLVSWMFKGGQSRWSIVENSVYGLAVLGLVAGTVSEIAMLKTEIGRRLANGGLQQKDVRDCAAIEIRGRAATLYRNGHWSSPIEVEIAQADHAKLKPLLEEFADLISPETSGQASSDDLF